ncbi:sigma-54-dependent Fis family transcriptional regulator [Prosthecochloris sp. GSB1]|uniref:sigma-54-dependent transcriptional regulator n=1 Tax=Prosthecochloris sp. GSB1 TaxID=281093 RepID=UPI000B8D1B99|nr:sigma-54 dependent transcriptional regulator [Prosthecochloris sp. GSB1]ASQ90140.1 sigma-54-dependent Fis family transcriptional regulator [Prosthecochloris sp. GSB1]
MLPSYKQNKSEQKQPKRHYRVLIADDEKSTRILLTHFLKKMGYEPVDAIDGEECIEILEREHIDLLLLDITMPKKDGFAVMSYLQDKGLSLPVIMVTASHDIPQTVKCIKMGAYEYLTKPLDVDRLQIVLRNAITESELYNKVSQLKKELKSKEIFRNIVGESPAIRQAMEHALQVMETELNVLILGESGTGKELFAQAIHEGSRRKNGPFVTINCAAITNELADSLLFGHVKGSFTGANADHTGFFEQADGGTIFLDEIGDMSLDIQAKVLRVLQEKKIRRVGEKKERSVDFRVISATHRNFSQAISNNSFRDDLYYRLEEYPLYIPPLRDRKEDILLIAKHFLEEFCSANNLKPLTMSAEAVAEMIEHDWPGNVRELKNAIQRTAIRSKQTGEITSITQPGTRPFNQVEKPVPAANPADRKAPPPPGEKPGAIQSLGEIERLAIEKAYEACDRNPTKTAKVLGIGRATLYRKLKKFGLN